ncbi:WD40 repeat domain-containing protein [Phanerochaete sordida]|uniref:WD40 repeat domain-containing protein n=1 Tax=Phanerochaete sordida TaxID=48140 RepID=A0A9P3LGF8_9APHY|nr:WD40 repeat domain-containing protein [Phanerochaete sordida]
MFDIYRPQSTSEDPTSPFVVYPSNLFSLKLGYALWYPEPHKPTGQPQIGDVGYIREGAFIRLFNINVSKSDHGVEFWKPPYEPEDPPGADVFLLDQRSGPITPGHYPSRGVRKKELGGSVSAGASGTSAGLSAGYTCKESEGSMLVLQSQASSESVFESCRLKEYMARHHDVWSHHVRVTVGHEIRKEDIVLIGGWVKTSADWAAMAFCKVARKHHASLKGKAGGFLGLELFGSRARLESGAKSHRQGEDYARAAGTLANNPDQNQSVFLRRYKIKRKLVVLKTIVAGAGYDRRYRRGPGGGTGEGVVADEDFTVDPRDDGLMFSERQVPDPLDALLDYILEVSSAEVAIAYDQDMDSLVGYQDWPIDVSTFLRKVQPPVDVTDGCGIISITGLLAQEQYKQSQHRFISAEDLRKWTHLTSDGAATLSDAPARFTDHRTLSPFLPKMWPFLRFDTKMRAAGPAKTCSVSKDGTLLASVMEGQYVSMWRLSDGLRVLRLAERCHTGRISAIDISPDSAALVSASQDKTAIVWSITTGEELFRLSGHQGGIVCAVYSPDGRYIVTADDTSVKLWDAVRGAPRCSYHFSNPIRQLLFSLGGSRLAARTDKSVALFSIEANTPIVQRILPSVQDRPPRIDSIALSSDGSRLAAFSEDQDGLRGQIYDTSTCRAVADFQPLSRVVSAAFDPECMVLATAAREETAETWDAKTGELCDEYQVVRPSTAVAFSADGRFFAAAGGKREGIIRVWVRGTKALVVEFKSPVGDIQDMQFLSDSRRLLTFGAEGSVCLWDVGNTLRVR